jgi:hypothetical protein
MDALHFACEMRGATQTYLDIYEHPDGLRQLMEIGLDFNIRFQEAQMERIGGFGNGCFVWLGDWVPFPRAVSLSVDAYVVCSPECYARLGFEYQSRLIRHFGHGLLHFHCNRADLAAVAAKLLHVHELVHVTTTQPDVGVIVHAPAGDIASVASALAAKGIHVSFATEPSMRTSAWRFDLLHSVSTFCLISSAAVSMSCLSFAVGVNSRRALAHTLSMFKSETLAMGSC